MNQIIENMPDTEYHARPEISKHDLDLIRRAPLAFRYAKDNPRPVDRFINFGSLSHLLLLEPDRLDSAVAVLPKNAPRKVSDRLRNAKNKSSETLEAIAWWEEWDRQTAGKQLATAESLRKVRGMQKSLYAKESTRRFLQMPGMREASLFWKMNGVDCRARLDIWGDEIIVDAKTTGDASVNGFTKDIGRDRHDCQGAYYIDATKALGRPAKTFVFVVVETEEPYLCNYYVLGSSSISMGRVANNMAHATYKKCRDSGKWPNMEDPFGPIEVPTWAL